MREIKFRAYEKDESIEFTLKEAIFRSYPDPFIESVDSPIVQYTGLKDRKEKEVYEGSIIDVFILTTGKVYNNFSNKEVVEHNGAFGFYVRNNFIPLSNIDFDILGTEIIGNIFENKNLLK